MYHLKQKICMGMIVLFCFGLSGCLFALGGAAGGGAALFFKGRLQENISYDFQTTNQAVRQGLSSLTLPLTKDEVDVDSASFESKYPDGTHVWIGTRYIASNTTRVTIRVGVTGDEHRSRQIWDEIRKYLN
ncbi:DUF3568 family protein [Desulfonatronovibrio magnus]|uniref:DUF3568 family protein n=1 Tax=Desulfonatronovibrio magnus TaxID=698827 RepID=UPI00069874E6|nr:DUF3568 family protein [Desulfonatronovibrio magnus]